MPLSQKQLKALRKLAHHQKVIVTVGQHGLTDAVMFELDKALEIHELLKVRISAGDKTEREPIIDKIAQQTQSEIVQCIGHVAVFYRQGENNKFSQ